MLKHNYKILFGIRPTSSDLHLGHISLLSKIPEFIYNNIHFDKTDDNNINEFTIQILLADAHALTTGTDQDKKTVYHSLKNNIKKLKEQIVKTLSFYFIKYNIKKYHQNKHTYVYELSSNKKIFIKIEFYNQIPELVFDDIIYNHKSLELFMKIINIIGYSEITSIPPIRDFEKNKKKNEYLSAGFINYPLLQTADIISLNPNIVFIGNDQLPNIKIYKKIINKLNTIFDYNLRPVKFMISDLVIQGFDDRKMSKSYGNTINIFTDTENDLKKKISLYKTDGHLKNETGNPSNCKFYHFIKNFLSTNEINELSSYCKSTNSLCKVCKEKYTDKLLSLRNNINE